MQIADTEYTTESDEWSKNHVVQIDTDIDRVARFEILDAMRLALLKWGAESRLTVHAIESGRLVGEVKLSENDLTAVENHVVEQLTSCEIARFNEVATPGTPRFTFETIFIDNGKVYVGWLLKVFIRNEVMLEEDQVAVISLLKDDYDLANHSILIPSGINCSGGRFNLRFDLKSANTVWNDTAYLQRHADYLPLGEPVYEIIPLSAPHAEDAPLYSRYRMDAENDLFWHKRTEPFEMTAYYGFHFLNDDMDLLCYTRENPDLYFFDTSRKKYDLRCTEFGIPWSFQRKAGRLYFTSTGYTSPLHYCTLHIADTTGRCTAELPFTSNQDDKTKPYYMSAKTYNGKFYIMSYDGGKFFLEEYIFRN